MAELRCPKCGKGNPDILDNCQFCQTPLRKKTDSLHIGQTPTKKDTGELESVLPDWLKNVRTQARDSAEEDAAQAAASQPKIEKEEPPDLLAGLASQTESGDDEIPDWLASINPVAHPEPEAPFTGSMPSPSVSAPEPEADFFARFRQEEDKSAGAPVQKSVPAFVEPVADQAPDATDEDDLSKWFARASEQPAETIEFDTDSQFQGEAGWGREVAAPPPPAQELAPKEQEDLSWLHNLEDVAKQTGDLQAPQQSDDWQANLETPSRASEPSGTREDLSWLDNLGGVETPQAPAQAFSAGEDLDWLKNLDAVTNPPPAEAASEKPAPASPFTSGEDLSWLKNLGETPVEAQPVEAASSPSSSDDLSWLNDLGGTPAKAEPAEAAPAFSSQEDLSWLSNLGGTPVEAQPAEAAPAPFAQEDLSWLSDLGGGSQPTSPLAGPESSASAAPLTPAGGKEEVAEPDWLTSAIEASAAPPSSDTLPDWFASTEQPVTPAQPVKEPPAPPADAIPAAPPFGNLFATPSEPASLPGQDVDSLFSVEMPDWLSGSEPTTEDGIVLQKDARPQAEGEESLAPVDLPSWVQAMRPVEAVISEPAPGAAEGPEEQEGPLAGLRGVIPGAAIGLSSKPKAISLTLQATSEHQAGAALLEDILASETSPRALLTSLLVTSQRALRWTLTAFFLLVLSAVILLRSQMLPINPGLAEAGKSAAAAVAGIPADAKVLVVIDYEPSLAGEMEAVGGPLLDHMTVQRNPQFSFVSMSPSGSALADRLVANTLNVSDLGVQYRNLGFLPGGSTGVLGFVEDPNRIISASDVESFSEYGALILMTDHAESGRTWIEQLQARKQVDADLASKPLIVIASAQAGPLLQPYVLSGQVTGMVSGLSDAARYEYMNGTRPGIARSYWDAFGVGLLMAVLLIALGSLWSLIAGIRARRAEAEQG